MPHSAITNCLPATKLGAYVRSWIDQGLTATSESEGRLWSSCTKAGYQDIFLERVRIAPSLHFSGMSEEGSTPPMAFLPDPSSIDPVPARLSGLIPSVRKFALLLHCPEQSTPPKTQ